MYDVFDIVKYIVWHEAKEDRPVTHLRLQKLLYFVQAVFLTVWGEPCFNATMEAWEYGPVIPEVYSEYKIFGSSCIPAPRGFSDRFLTDQARSQINQMLDICSKYTTHELVELTHEQDPWKNAYKKSFNHEITNQAITSYFA